MGRKTDNYEITHLGQDSFLTMPHRRPHRSQLDVEVRADENVLVRVGSSGRLATIVTDNTRKKRTIVHFQATNTGLASARFKAVIRDCGPELSTLMKQKGTEEIASEPIVLPPYHTRRLQLEVPVEIPTDATHCNVALVNDEDESIAVRDVSIKKGDRCFCVWHCECVCLSEDPKLLCREMSQTQQVAAGLTPTTERSRHTRSVCFPDIVAIDFVTVFLTVILLLLLLGLLKAFLGLFSVRIKQLGWDCLLVSRRLDCYYEPCLRDRKVVHQDGWPVHPDTKQRTVRILSCPASFLVNLVFFIVVPCIVMYSFLKKIFGAMGQWFYSFYTRCKCKTWKTDEQIFNAHDVQNSSVELLLRKKRQGRDLNSWMGPCAEQLTADVLRGAMDPTSSTCCATNEMQPLLNDKQPQPQTPGQGCAECPACRPPSTDSDREDTEFVLMQMQKSRDSLARSGKKFDDSLQSDLNQSQTQTKGALTIPRQNKN
ncbi:hypothetical protein NE865_11909 [Phthorimaea operculella]|nr:hypothetical protein NE865_11909 [Phthorimaea operculella]